MNKLFFILFCLFISCKKENLADHRYCQVKFFKLLNIPNYSEFYIDNIKGDKNNYGYGGSCHIGSIIKIISDTIKISGIYVQYSSDFYLMVFNGYNDTLYNHLYQSINNQTVTYIIK